MNGAGDDSSANNSGNFKDKGVSPFENGEEENGFPRFGKGEPPQMPEDGGTLALTVHLCSTMIYSFDLTIRNLTDSGEAIAVDTVLARNCFLDRLASLRQDR